MSSTQDFFTLALHQAVVNGDTGKIKDILDKGADLHWKNLEDQTFLHLAVRRNYLTTTTCLLENGANPNTQDAYGDTPLHDAAANNYISIAELLLECKTDISLKNKEGKTAFDLAVAAGAAEIVDAINDIVRKEKTKSGNILQRTQKNLALLDKIAPRRHRPNNP